MQDTRVIQASAPRSHEELLNRKKQAHEAEARIKELEQELEQVSELVHEDQLTGALNRRGLDETLERELNVPTAASRRQCRNARHRQFQAPQRLARASGGRPRSGAPDPSSKKPCGLPIR